MATVLAPAMPWAALGWVPGAAFGLGTTAVHAGAGAVIGSLIRRQRLPEHLAQRVAQEGAGWTLLASGALFAVDGVAGLAVPSVMTARIATASTSTTSARSGPAPSVSSLVLVVAAVTIARMMHRLRNLPAGHWPAASTHVGGPPPRTPTRSASGRG